MAKEIWVRVDIYGVDNYEDFIPRITVPGGSGNIVGPIDESFDSDEYVVSPNIALANGKFYGVALVRGEEKDGVAYVRGERIGEIDKKAAPDINNGSLPIMDGHGGVCSRCVEGRENAMKWADRESEMGSVVLTNGDFGEHDCKRQATVRRDVDTYALRRSVIDRINGMHQGAGMRM